MTSRPRWLSALPRQVITALCFFVLVVATTGGTAPSNRKLVIGVDGGTESIRACCFDAVTGDVVGKSCAVPYKTYHPQPGWAEQDPADWYQNMGEAVRGAVHSIPGKRLDYEVCSICIDTTCCSVVALDENKEPLRNCLLWMDSRSAPQTREIMSKCKGDPALRVNCGGEGPLSAEWMTPKALWIRQNQPEIWAKAATVCEYQDYINYKLTGEMCASSCNAASRWHWDGEECIMDGTTENPYPGRPLSLYKKLGIPELADKLPRRCLPMGSHVGKLTPEASKHLGLPIGVPVTQGGPDAFVGMVGLGCINPGQMCLITGSSHLHCVVSSTPASSKGVWGAYKGAPLPGINFAEGGQSSTGSIIRWARNLFGASDIEYRELDAEAAAISPGSDGLIALETFQGSRTPVTDPLAKGALLGITLSHTRAHIWRAFMESVCFGTRACVAALENAGHKCEEIVMAGGATRSELWLQMHADVTNKPVVVCENADAPLLGCAILASVSSGVHKSVQDAVDSMVHIKKRLQPTDDVAVEYDKVYREIYSQVGDAVRPVAHAIASCRGGHIDDEGSATEPSNKNVPESFPRNVTISPSLLAADWANMKNEVQRCIDIGLHRLHVDVFDGVFLDSPYALTFGPQMVSAIRKCSDQAFLDLHMCVDRPARYITPMKEAGADSFIFQWEATEDVVEAIQLAKAVVDAGMQCGVSINPTTPAKDLYPLLKTGLVSIVDVLAVEPGFGGQVFQECAIDKVEALLHFRRSEGVAFEVMVDGGINQETAEKTRADILVAGTFLFQHPESIRSAFNALRLAWASHSSR
jgi:ribulose-phosphate 3-epimerase